MPTVHKYQTSFTAGELDPKLAARRDIKFYFSGAEKLRNGIPLPSGGVKRRPGFSHVFTLPSDTTFYTNNETNHFRIIPFQFSTTEQYVMVLGHDGTDCYLRIFLDDALDQTLTGFPYDHDQIPEVHWTQSLDTLILVHPEHQPEQVVRSGGSFSRSQLTLSNIPQYDFDDSSSPTEQDEIQRISFSGMSAADAFDLSLEGETTQELQWSSTDSDNISNIETALNRLPNVAGDITVATQSASTYDVTFGGDDQKEWENIGVLILTGSGSASVSEQQSGSDGSEDVWSSDRGWPKTATFYQARLWFGGSRDRPQTLWGSKIADFFDFDTGRNLDNEAIAVTADTNTVSEIRGIHPGRNLQIMTSTGEFYVPDEPITPDNVRFKQATKNGMKPNIPLVETDGATLYMQRGGKAILEFLFTVTEDTYQSNNISLLSSHLLSSPVDMALRPSSETDETNLVLIVNDDGSIAALSTLRNQDVTAFSKLGTRGTVQETGVLDFDVYQVTERFISANEPASGQPVYHLEKWNENHFLDASHRKTFPDVIDDFEDGDISEYGGDTGSFNVQSSTTLVGLDTLEGTGAGVISDTTPTVFPGMILQAHVQAKTDGAAGLLYGTQGENGAGSISGYKAILDVDNNDVELVRVDNGTDTSLFKKSVSRGVSAGTEYLLRVKWDDNNKHFIELQDADGNELVSTKTTEAPSDDNYTSGGIGWISPANGAFFDHYVVDGQKVIKNNLSHLNGEDVLVYADGMNLPEVNPTGGEATIDRYALDHVEFGFNFDPIPEIQTMPLSIQLPDGPAMSREKRIVEATLRLHQTKAINVNGQVVPFRQFGDTFLDAEIPTFTGDKQIKGFLGWNRRGQLTITQPNPQPFTILGVDMKVSV